MTAFIDAIRAHGQNRLAEQVGVTPQAVYLWVRNKKVPAERALAVAQALGMQPHELRPDLYPPPRPTPSRRRERAAVT